MADIYCDNTNGNDSTGDGSSGTPYKTLQKCVDNAAGGDVIWIGDTSAQVLATAIDWTSGYGAGDAYATPLLIRGWDYSAGAGVAGIGEIDCNSAVATWDSATSRPWYVCLYDLYIHDTTGGTITGSWYWRVIDCEIANSGGIGIKTGQVNLIYGCNIHDTDSYGIGVSANSEVVSNRIANATDRGIDTDGNNVVIANNLLDLGPGIASGDYGILDIHDHVTIRDNTIIGDSNNGTGIRVWSSASNGAVILNNIITGFATGVVDGGADISVYGFNQFYDNTTDETLTGIIAVNLGNNSTADPAFVGSGDYTPTAFVDGWPTTLGPSTVSEIKIGAVQEAGGAAGGGLLEPGSMTGGMV